LINGQRVIKGVHWSCYQIPTMNNAWGAMVKHEILMNLICQNQHQSI